jgi:hypothetical protein
LVVEEKRKKEGKKEGKNWTRDTKMNKCISQGRIAKTIQAQAISSNLFDGGIE